MLSSDEILIYNLHWVENCYISLESRFRQDVLDYPFHAELGLDVQVVGGHLSVLQGAAALG